MADEKRLIDANALFHELVELQYSEQTMGIVASGYPHMRAIVAKQPTVDAVEVVHGEWEPHPYHPGLVRCSKCKEQIIPEDMVDEEIYCSKCGTKLGG